MPPPCGSTEGTDRNADSVWPSGWHFLCVNAGKHTEESEVALDVFVQLLEGNGGAQLLVEVGLVSGKLHVGHKMGRLLLVQQPGIAKALNITALGHEITLLHMLGSQTMLNRPWELSRYCLAIGRLFLPYPYHIRARPWSLGSSKNDIATPTLGLRYAYATIWYLSLCNKMVGFGCRVLANGKEKRLKSLQSVSLW